MSQTFWISGGLHERKLTLNKIKSQFPNANILNASGDFTVAYLEHLVRQEACFADERIVIVKNMPYPSTTRPTMVNHLKKLIDTVPSNCILVFDGISASDEKAISSHIGKAGKLIVTDEKLTNDNGIKWISSILSEYNKEIEPADAELLMDTCGYDKGIGGIGVDVMRIACEKLAIYLGRRKNVTTDDVMNTAVPSQDFVIWKIFDAMDSRNICNCHNAYERLCDHEGSVVGATNILFAICLPRYRLMLFLKESLAGGMSKQETANRALEMPKLTSEGKDWEMRMSEDVGENGTKKAFSEFVINSLLFGSHGKKPALELYSRRDLVRIVRTLFQGATEVRARGGSSGVKLLADSLFLATCTTLSDEVLGSLRESYNYV